MCSDNSFIIITAIPAVLIGNSLNTTLNGLTVIFSQRTTSINFVLPTCFISSGVTCFVDILRFNGVDSLPAGSGLLCLAAVGRLAACLPCVSRRFIPVKVKIISVLHQTCLREDKKLNLSPVNNYLALIQSQIANIFRCILN